MSDDEIRAALSNLSFDQMAKSDWLKRVGRASERINKHISPDDDLIAIILRGHLIIEAELTDIYERLLKNPAALESGGNLRFSLKLRLVRALAGDDALTVVRCFRDRQVRQNMWLALGELNTLRNELAHKLEPEDLDKAIDNFIKHFDGFTLPNKQPYRLIACLEVLCSLLCSIVSNDDQAADPILSSINDAIT
jgi:hypothetical protein